MGKVCLRLLLSAGLFFSFVSNAVVLRNVELVNQGALGGQGDLIRVSLLFSEGESELTLVVRPLRVFGDKGEKVSLIPLNRNQRQGDEQFVVVKFPVDGGNFKENNGFVDVSIPVPYILFETEDAGWRPGYKMGYQISGIHEGPTPVTDFVTPTDLTVFQPFRPEALAMMSKGQKSREQSEEKQVWGYVLKYDEATHSMKRENVSVMVRARKHDEGEAARAAVKKPSAAFGERRGALGLSTDLKTKYAVYYATNRKWVSNVQTEDRFGYEVADYLTYGSMYVNIPVTVHRRGDMEVSHWWKWTSESNVFGIYSLTSLAERDFVASTSKDDLLIFVHGFNTNFSKATLIAAQIAYDIGFPGKVMTFSWPSQGEISVSAYNKDAESAEASVPALVHFLRTVINGSKDGKHRKIHLIAHSMGNEVLMPALRNLELENPGITRKAFQNVILTAPDVGEGKFASLLPTVIETAQNVSFYYSTEDWALGVSDTINGQNRAGLFPIFFKGMDTINTDDVNSSFIGHTYYNTSVPVLNDLFLLINRNLKPDFRRPPLAAKETLRGFDGFPHYRFLPE